MAASGCRTRCAASRCRRRPAPAKPESTAARRAHAGAQAGSVGLLAAWRIPGVASFAATLFFCKLVAYTFLYWLPFYLSTTEIGGRRLSPQARARGPCAAPPC